MGTHDLPDMYARSPRALGIHIRQITHAHVTTINCVSIQLLSLYIVYFKNYFNCAIVPVQCDVIHNDLVY